MQHPLTILLAGMAIALIARPVAADPWYEHYANAELALEQQDWTLAVQQLNAALEKKGDSGARVRSYGMNVVAYFPYFRLGMAYYYLGQFDAALQAFETESRLGAIAESESASAELSRLRSLAEQAKAAQQADEQRRIRVIVADNLERAAQLEDQGKIADAIAAVDRALAVAPGDEEAVGVMAGLRQRLADQKQEQDLDRRVTGLVERGRAALVGGNYEEASSLLGEALYLRPDPAIQSLVDTAQSKLRAGLDPGAAAGLAEVESLEAAGRLVEALDRLQSILALDPGNAEARLVQRRLLELRNDRRQASDRRAAIDELLADATARFDAGSTEEALAAANQALALEPGNPAALELIARAYALINRRLLGARPGSNIPPAVRFVDLRGEDPSGLLVQATRTPDFRLNGVVIDESPVTVAMFVNDAAIEPALNSQALGDFFLTEFSIELQLPPGRSTFRLVASDAEGLSSGSEYAVLYDQPLVRKPWFPVLLLSVALFAVAIPVLRGQRQRAELRHRKFNPYVAGAPVLNDEMFFGRRDLVNRILQTIHNNSLLLYGERRIGKTSIQHQLKRRLLNLDDPHYEFYPVYIDLQGTPQQQFFRTIAEEIVEELAPKLQGFTLTGSGPANYSYRDFVSDLRKILGNLQSGSSKTVKLVLLIDEVDELNEYDPRINQRLRSLFMKNFAENLVAVVSGVEIKKRWQREGSPWYNFFEEIEVRPFGTREARELIRKPIDGMFRADDDAVDRIISLTGGRPYQIQKFCVALVTRLHQQRRRKITIADVDAVAGGGDAVDMQRPPASLAAQ